MPFNISDNALMFRFNNFLRMARTPVDDAYLGAVKDGTCRGVYCTLYIIAICPVLGEP